MKELNYIRILAKANRSRAESRNASEVYFEWYSPLSRAGQYTLAILSLEHHFQLVCLLRQQFTVVEDIVNSPKYEVFTLQKKRGGKRVITAPIYGTKYAQFRLNEFLQGYYSLIRPASSYGFVRASEHDTTPPSIVGNAMPHVAQPHIYSLDLKDYFSNITTKQVYRLFQSELFDFNQTIAQTLTLLVTYEGCLPTGAPTSPVIANFCTLLLDHELMDFAAQNELNYTRYADDMTFSSQEFIRPEIRSTIDQLIEGHGFLINPKKVHYRHPHQQHRVTGVIVNKKINVDRKYMKATRAMVHDLCTNGAADATQNHYRLERPPFDTEIERFVNKLGGRISFIRSVRGNLDPTAMAFYLSFQDALEKLEMK
ncbi:MAG: reverse transcriptase family protein [Crocinitomicaceae bacterium]|nr:reverse transcriptase family protein [Crocinitomicaceae bacterium]